ncbi:MAG TPA: phospholipase D-like domain-containing protein [Prosthecobacter sp.]|nr:phospholipase D-like domain-containing protein [Prosthecobacter sp.]
MRTKTSHSRRPSSGPGHSAKNAKHPRPKGSRRERYFNFLAKKLGPVTVRGWLEIFAVVLGVLIAYSILFVRRDAIQYRPDHTFNVRSPEFFSSAHGATDPVPIGGNKITLLHNGDGTFPVLLKAIRGAQKTVNFEAFLFHSGAVGTEFIRAFCERAQAGVQVRILLDGIGSGSALDGGDVSTMKKAGCKFEYYHPVRAVRVDRINRRSHRRVLVVDGKVAFTGGIGFADDWLGNADSPDHWRDIHIQVQGPIVAKFQSAFQQHWLNETQELLTGADHFPELKSIGNLRAQVTSSDEFSVAAVPLIQAVAIAAAEKTIYITNPYCTPTEDQVDLLTAAVQRGVDVRLLLPGPHNDQPMTKAAGRTGYGKLLKGGVKIFEYTPTMIHSKTMVVDGMFSLLGTSNLDARSAQINNEIDLSVYDESFGAEMDRVFLKDLELSKPYTEGQFKKRGLWERFSEWATLPFRSQL